MSPLTLLVSLPELLINTLTSKPQQHSVAYHYVAGEVPFVIAAMVLGLRRLAGALGRRAFAARPARLRRLLAGLVMLVALVATFTAGPLSGARPGWGLALTPAHRAVISEAIAMIPANASVSADNALGAHLSARQRITTFPVIAEAAYVVLDSQGRYGPLRTRELEKLRRDDRYQLIFEREGVLVFKRAR